MSNPDLLVGTTELLDPIEYGYQPTEGDGMIHCVSALNGGPKTTWSMKGDGREQAMDENVVWPAGDFVMVFKVAGGATPPEPRPVTVRAGLNTLVIVDYNEKAAPAP